MVPIARESGGSANSAATGRAGEFFGGERPSFGEEWPGGAVINGGDMVNIITPVAAAGGSVQMCGSRAMELKSWNRALLKDLGLGGLRLLEAPSSS